jgi:hypothetical protein
MTQLLILFTVATGASAFFQYDGFKPRLLARNVGMRTLIPSASDLSSYKVLERKTTTPIIRVVHIALF